MEIEFITVSKEWNDVIELSSLGEEGILKWKEQAIEALDNWYAFELNRIDEICNAALYGQK